MYLAIIESNSRGGREHTSRVSGETSNLGLRHAFLFVLGRSSYFERLGFMSGQFYPSHQRVQRALVCWRKICQNPAVFIQPTTQDFKSLMKDCIPPSNKVPMPRPPLFIKNIPEGRHKGGGHGQVCQREPFTNKEGPVCQSLVQYCQPLTSILFRGCYYTRMNPIHDCLSWDHPSINCLPEIASGVQKVGQHQGLHSITFPQAPAQIYHSSRRIGQRDRLRSQ